MSKPLSVSRKPVVVGLIVTIMTMVWLPKAHQYTPSAAAPPLKVHVAIGLHVSPYPSFRTQTIARNHALAVADQTGASFLAGNGTALSVGRIPSAGRTLERLFSIVPVLWDAQHHPFNNSAQA